MSINVKYVKGAVDTKITSINEKVNNKLMSQVPDEYSSIMNLIQVSKGEQIEAVNQELQQELNTIHEIATFFTTVTAMMKSASENLDEVEQIYGQARLK